MFCVWLAVMAGIVCCQLHSVLSIAAHGCVGVPVLLCARARVAGRLPSAREILSRVVGGRLEVDGGRFGEV